MFLFKKQTQKLLIIVVVIFSIIGCNKNEQQEIIHNNIKLQIINASEFLNQFKQKNKRVSQRKTKTRKNNILDFQIITEKTKYIKNGTYESYTFPIIRKNPYQNITENYVISKNNDGTFKEYLILYFANAEKLNQINNTILDNIKIKIIDLEKIKTQNNLNIAKRNAVSIFDAIPDGCFEIVLDCDCESGIAIREIDCPEPPRNGNNGSNPSDNNISSGGNTEGGSSGGGANREIITAPNTVPYTSQLKNFLSYTLKDTKIRNYYTSNTNIKHFIERELIKANFSPFKKFQVLEILTFGVELKLNSQEFIWAFNNSDSKNFRDIENYLGNNPSQQKILFVKEAIDVLNNDKTESFKDFLFDEQIFIDKDFKDNPCLKSVYNAMGKTTKFKEYLQNFEPEFSVAHLRLKYDENFKDNKDPKYWNALAITEPPLNGANNSTVANYNINITFNGDSNLDASIHNKPKLIIAVAFIHEMIHAEVFRKMLSAAQQGHLNTSQYTTQNRIDYVNSLRNNFPGIYDYYVERWKSNWGHQQMAQHYRNIIVGALKEFDNNQHTQAQYEAIAWLGLDGTVAWNNLTQPEKDNITQTRTNFINNDTDKCN